VSTADYRVGDEVEMMLNGRALDRAIVREIVVHRPEHAKILTLEWRIGAMQRQSRGELRRRRASQSNSARHRS
jgi:hypothetical protein